MNEPLNQLWYPGPMFASVDSFSRCSRRLLPEALDTIRLRIAFRTNSVYQPVSVCTFYVFGICSTDRLLEIQLDWSGSPCINIACV